MYKVEATTHFPGACTISWLRLADVDGRSRSGVANLEGDMVSLLAERSKLPDGSSINYQHVPTLCRVFVKQQRGRVQCIGKQRRTRLFVMTP